MLVVSLLVLTCTRKIPQLSLHDNYLVGSMHRGPGVESPKIPTIRRAEALRLPFNKISLL